MFDTHVHTTFSTDSKMNIENALKSAKKRGVALILTEHMDIGYPNQGEFIF
jgi:histidinol-phosphatase (PHP family)